MTLGRTALVTALALALSVPGCLGGAFQGLDATPATEVAALHQRLLPFSYADAVDPDASPDRLAGASSVGSATFDVPEGAEWIEVFYGVSFDDASPAPSAGTQWLVLELDGPGADEEATVRLERSSQGSWRFDRPHPGVWTYHYEARGQGQLLVIVHGQVPAS